MRSIQETSNLQVWPLPRRFMCPLHMSKPKIYISSTFFDLEDHRRSLIAALGKIEQFDIVSMENYGTRSAPPLQKCLEDVERSEFYILLLGQRYGYIPDGQKYSITNLEYKKAIGDTDTSAVAATPDYNKCVLPFIMESEKIYQLSDPVKVRINAEKEADGEAVTTDKQDKLAALKKKITKDFTIDKYFTSPEDLTTKVLGALMFELMERGYADVLNTLKLSKNLAERCNRERIRNDFLSENFYNQNFYRLYIVHGETAELPMVFSNNLSTYELGVQESAATYNLEEYMSCTPERFLSKLARDLYNSVFRDWPDTPVYTLKELAEKVIADEHITNFVFKFDLYYWSWKEKYKKHLAFFFEQIKQVNASLRTPKNFYLFMNINYDSQKEKLKETPAAAVILDRLTKINITHIEQWVRTFFFKSTRKTDLNSNRAERMAKRISDYYFQQYLQPGKDFCMQEAIDKLEAIINDFNDNKNLFENYQKLFR